MLPFTLEWDNPDYSRVIKQRYAMLKWMRNSGVSPSTGKMQTAEARKAILAARYRLHPEDFIEDWGCTYDPRNAGEPNARTIMPFILFPKQRAWMQWAFQRWVAKEEGITEKSRDMGLSWLSMALGCTLCIFYPNMVVGFGSRKEEYVDKAGFPRSLFYKGRLFMENLPVEFQGGWQRRTDAHMRLSFPATHSVITGESGDNIGRGDRTGMYVTDEDAQIEHPDMVDAALSATTNCRLRVSSANGTSNPFYLKRQQYVGTERLFTFHWRDNPLWSQARYDRKSAEVNNPVIMAQEYDINYSASVENVLIPAAWVNAAVDAHRKLGFGFDGDRFAGLDLADGGKDLNAACGAHGVVVDHLEEWSGGASNLFRTAQRAFTICDLKRYGRLRYDADGIGASMKGDAEQINLGRPGSELRVEPWRASGAVVEADKKIPGTDRTNKDFFANAKAQGYWDLRDRFRKVYLALDDLAAGVPAQQVLKRYPADELISFDSGALDPGQLAKAMTELSQPTGAPNGAGKMVVDKAPDEAPSPNYADAIMIRFARGNRAAMRVTLEALDMIRSAGARG